MKVPPIETCAMKIGFLDPSFGYRVETAYQEPLGGSQSALCYLAEALAQRGHDVFIFTTTETIALSRGVICLPVKIWSTSVVHSLQLDALVVLNTTELGQEIKASLQPQTRFLFWVQHAVNQPGVKALATPASRDTYDYFVMVSNWQQSCFQQRFEIPKERFKVLRNAISPQFNARFAQAESILTAKQKPPIIAYTSTPFRGLDLLVEVFSQIRQAIPGTRLKVFSSMKVYQVSSEKDQFRHLYQQCQQIEGIDYVGSLPQPQLAQELQSITALTYPNTFPETSCIAVMEAMASGCQIITSQLGALPETTAGFAHLVPVLEGDREGYKANFVQTTVEVLQQALEQPNEVEHQLQNQIIYVNQNYTWAARAKEWEEWLESICTEPPLALESRSNEWQQQAKHFWQQDNYEQAIALYEKGIADEPAEISHYWAWGILLILVGKEEEAQVAWSMILADAEPEQIESWTIELVNLLELEVKHQQSRSNLDLAWILRRYIQEFLPQNLPNVLASIQLAMELGIDPDLEPVISVLMSNLLSDPDLELLKRILQQLIQDYSTNPFVLEFAQTCFQLFPESQQLIEIILVSTAQLLDSPHQNVSVPQALKTPLLKLCVSYAPKDFGALSHLVNLSYNTGHFEAAADLAKQWLNLSTRLPDRIAANYQYLRNLLMSGGSWGKIRSLEQNYWHLLNQLVESSVEVDRFHVTQLLRTTLLLPYLEDEPEKIHRLRSLMGGYCQEKITHHFPATADFCQRSLYVRSKKDSTQKLKIGYLSSCLRRHSVGWLLRSLLTHHDHESFQICAYSLVRSGDNVQQWISNHVSEFIDMADINEVDQIAEQICQDQVDILVDLDGITFAKISGVMALKPAPVQITWLGFDASGLPAIDYFIADPYVLPETAQTYYTEKIWRLPQTYIAIDGFEVGLPTLRREDLGIPNYGVVYLSFQTGQKRRPENIRLQMQILQQVENSYLLIKGWSDQESVQKLCKEVAADLGVEKNRLRFLPLDDTSEAHRANIAIADVVLDTYPYNGATTTLETLWMGVPLVTRVGEQFAARNSYGFLVNVGVSEGIAWTDDEYVNWGVRFGNEPQLRQDVAWKLRASRQTSPLWNAKKFTLELEKAFRQMWETYLM
jgi:predicted O-linked N-acetylglucosamine transferase (SPINDLY family)/glycosyltransferase involved in cell wall biosynthesis